MSHEISWGACKLAQTLTNIKKKIKDKSIVLWPNSSRVLLWLIWKERNVRIFSDKLIFFIIFVTLYGSQHLIGVLNTDSILTTLLLPFRLEDLCLTLCLWKWDVLSLSVCPLDCFFLFLIWQFEIWTWALDLFTIYPLTQQATSSFGVLYIVLFWLLPLFEWRS